MGFRITELSRPAIDGPSVLGSRDRPATPIPYHYRSTSLRMCVDGLQDWRLLGTAHEASSYPHVSLVSVFMHRTLPSLGGTSQVLHGTNSGPGLRTAGLSRSKKTLAAVDSGVTAG